MMLTHRHDSSLVLKKAYSCIFFSILRETDNREKMEFQEFLAIHRPDLVFLDEMMNELDEIEEENEIIEQENWEDRLVFSDF